jgi:DNA-nicking Smr family endonuclease
MHKAALRTIKLARPAPAVAEPFAEAIAGAVPLPTSARARVRPPTPPRRPRPPAPSLPAERAMVVERSGERLRARAVDVEASVLAELAAGLVRVEQTFDLHGARSADVLPTLTRVLLGARRDRRRCVLLVHGHGGDPRHARREAALRTEVRHALVGALSGLVLAAASAMPKDGGRGSTYVMVRS